MDARAALKAQYHAAMAMLKQTIEQCPDDLWAGGSSPVAHWRVVYHTLFFTQMYLQPNVEAFRPWQHHRDQHECLGELPYPPYGRPKIGDPYTKPQMLVAVVALLALNLVAHWGMSQPPPPGPALVVLHKFRLRLGLGAEELPA